MKLAEDRRAVFKKTDYLSAKRVMVIFEIPLSEIIYDFHDKLKSATRGYGTMDYEFKEYRSSDLVRMDILVAQKAVDALSAICHRTQAERRGRAILQKLRKEIPRHLFEIALQVGIGARIIARETISPMRKNVTAKCYGGDITRKRKLLEKQKEGKKRMKAIGNVQVPQEAFLAVLKASSEE
jgi:GTP-binding protein LepA